MINLIFTLDYELFGNGAGSLYEHVFKPAENMNEIFKRYGYKYVNFVEAAELIKIKNTGNDQYIVNVEKQIKLMHTEGYEIALHIHPQWFNAKLLDNKWIMDYDEYNLAELSKNKINLYLDICIKYLRDVLGDADYLPTSFRAGGWLIQPSENIAHVLADKGIRIESTVYKGGLQRYYNINFTNYPLGLYYWPFSKDVMHPDANGKIIEIPIHTEMVYPWKMLSSKRKKIYSSAKRNKQTGKQLLLSYYDKIRFKYPMKYDFTKMTFIELKSMLENIIEQDYKYDKQYKPIVLIGHPKNMPDLESIDRFLDLIKSKNLQVKTFMNILPNLQQS